MVEYRPMPWSSRGQGLPESSHGARAFYHTPASGPAGRGVELPLSHTVGTGSNEICSMQKRTSTTTAA